MLSLRSRAVNGGRPKLTIDQFIEIQEANDGVIRIACDTEFEDLHTLSIQFAARLHDKIVVQLYYSPAVPPPPANLARHLPDVSKWCKGGVLLRPAKPIIQDLSPARVLGDLFQLDLLPLPRYAFEDRPRPPKERQVVLRLIAHFWPADFFRICGRNHFGNLLRAVNEKDVKLSVQGHKLLAFREEKEYRPPILEFFRTNGDRYSLRVGYFDTCLPWGKATLDSLAFSFLGIQKSDALSKEDKGRMLSVFRERPLAAYTYAALDPILTLLVEEKMREEHQAMYRKLDFADEEIPAMRSTLGRRAATLIADLITKDTAKGSVVLSKNGKLRKDGTAGPVVQGKVKELLKRGSGTQLAEGRTYFKKQIGDTHGGLSYSRSPDKIFDQGVGQFADIDLSGCYGNIIAGMNLYVGRPRVFEPGKRQMLLKEAIAELRKYAAGDDAGFVKVSGRITRFPNTLILSTRNALTSENYQNRTARRRATSQFAGNDDKGTRVYTDVIQGGIVTWATWLMIQALPADWRREYEQLRVDSVVYYHKRLVADSGPEYDRLVALYSSGKPHWESEQVEGGLGNTTTERPDATSISLRFPLGNYAQKFLALRKEAKKNDGPKSAAAQGWKDFVNTIYGVTASPHLDTGNIVCANVITAKARALAFAMQTALNGYQVITDGCIYRRDQIPACTFAECLAASSEYPIHRVEEGIPFVNPAKVPTDDAGFTLCYRKHVKRFFGVKGADYDQLFGIHDLEHKLCGTPPQTFFDALCLDGSSTNVKLLQDGDGWKGADFKARGYRDEAKQTLLSWIVETYSSDQYQPPPMTESTSLVKWKEGRNLGLRSLTEMQQYDARMRAAEKPAKVYLPLGLERKTVQAYKIIRPSTFLFRTPEQEVKVAKAMDKFAKINGYGLEALALKRKQGKGGKGSVEAIAGYLYRYIRSGRDNLSKDFNLIRPSEALDKVHQEHFKPLLRRRAMNKFWLIEAIDTRSRDPEEILTGFMVDDQHVLPVSN